MGFLRTPLILDRILMSSSPQGYQNGAGSWNILEFHKSPNRNLRILAVISSRIEEILIDFFRNCWFSSPHSLVLAQIIFSTVSLDSVGFLDIPGPSWGRQGNQNDAESWNILGVHKPPNRESENSNCFPIREWGDLDDFLPKRLISFPAYTSFRPNHVWCSSIGFRRVAGYSGVVLVPRRGPKRSRIVKCYGISQVPQWNFDNPHCLIIRDGGNPNCFLPNLRIYFHVFIDSRLNAFLVKFRWNP